jgi:rhamnosyltransferase
MICAVIVSYNSDKIFRCYQSVKEQVDFVIIVDNATTDAVIIEKLKSIAQADGKLKLILSSANFGIAWALNQGVKYAKEKNCDWLLTLDQDSELAPDTVKNMMAAYGALSDEEKEKSSVLGCKYVERQIQCQGDASIGININPCVPLTLFKENNLMVTSGNFVKMSLFEKVGLFEEKLFIDYVDIEFYYRVLKAGFKNLEVQNVFILHEFGKSERKFGFHITNQPPFRRYYIARNCVYFFKEFIFIFPYRALRVLFGGTLGGAAKILLFEKEKLQKYKYILRGIKDALLNRYGK